MAAIEGISKEFRALVEHLEKSGALSKGLNDSMQETSHRIFTIANAVKLGGLEAVFHTVKTYATEWIKSLYTSSAVLKKDQGTLLSEIDALSNRIRLQRDSGKYLKNELEQQQKLLKELTDQHEFLKKRLVISELIETVWKRHRALSLTALATGTATLRMFESTLRASQEFSRALVNTNTNLAYRSVLMSQMLEAQAATGASTASMADSVQALTEYGMELHDNFQENLKLVTMMKDGLGVSAQTGAELVTVFQQGLKFPARDVADSVARIAQQTGLAATKAAQFAVEIGRALRMLGPGLRTEASGVTEVVEQLSARIQELGGNADTAVKLFERLTSGQAEGFMLRGRAGVAPGALTTAEGARTALENLGKSMQQIVTAAPGTNMYLAQLEAAAEIHGIAARDVRDYLEVIKQQNRPLSEAEALEKAYREQTLQTGQAFAQLRNTLGTLYERAMLPVIKAFNILLGQFTKFITWIANTKTAVVIAGVAVAGAATTAAISFIYLTKKLYDVAKASAAYATFLELSGLKDAYAGSGKILGGFKEVGKRLLMLPKDLLTGSAARDLSLKGLAQAMANTFSGMKTGGAATFAILRGLYGVVARLTPYTIAAAIGYTIGTYLEDKFKWGEKLYKHFSTTVNYRPMGRLGLLGRMEQIASIIAQHGKITAEARGMLRGVALDVGEKGTPAMLERVSAMTMKKMGDAAYVQQLKRPSTVRTGLDRAQDEENKAKIESTEAALTQVKLTQELVKVAKFSEQKKEMDRQREQDEQHSLWYWLFLNPAPATTQRSAFDNYIRALHGQ